MSQEHAPMVGIASGDPHKNSNRSKKVNDRDRRRHKRVEKRQFKSGIKSGTLLANVLTIRHSRRG